MLKSGQKQRGPEFPLQFSAGESSLVGGKDALLHKLLQHLQLVWVHIDSCDFSTGMYEAMSDPTDRDLKTFSFERTEKYILPMLTDAQKAAGKPLKLMLSPWSPPAFMKTNGNRVGGGKLKPEFRDFWADYICRYIEEFQKRGFYVQRISLQNEPKAVQTWDDLFFLFFIQQRVHISCRIGDRSAETLKGLESHLGIQIQHLIFHFLGVGVEWKDKGMAGVGLVGHSQVQVHGDHLSNRSLKAGPFRRTDRLCVSYALSCPDSQPFRQQRDSSQLSFQL